MSKTLVTGGTGLVGSHLLYFLVQRGLSPIAIKRESSDILKVEKVFSYYTKSYKTLFQKIIWEECDILDFLKLESIIKNVSKIYHCAALISFNNNLKNKMIEINATGTSNIVDLALKYNVQRVCYVSSIATLGSNSGLAVSEDCWWNWENQSGYAISKHLAEVEVWRGFAEGLSGIIVNPSLIIGPGSWESGIGTIINKTQSGIPFYPPGSCGLIEVKDLTEIMIKLMDSSITNERFIINSDHMSYKELIGLVATSLGKRKPTIKLNRFLMKLFISIDIIINKQRGKRIELSTDAVKYTTSKILLNTTKINNTINFSYRKMKDSLKECIDVFIKESNKKK